MIVVPALTVFVAFMFLGKPMDFVYDLPLGVVGEDADVEGSKEGGNGGGWSSGSASSSNSRSAALSACSARALNASSTTGPGTRNGVVLGVSTTPSCACLLWLIWNGVEKLMGIESLEDVSLPGPGICINRSSSEDTGCERESFTLPLLEDDGVGGPCEDGRCWRDVRRGFEDKLTTGGEADRALREERS